MMKLRLGNSAPAQNVRMHSQDVLLSISKLKLSRVRFSRMPSKPSIHRGTEVEPIEGVRGSAGEKSPSRT